MRDYRQFYINGAWVDPATPQTLDVIDPATERPAGQISLGSAADVDRAVAAARAAFDSFSQTSREDRLALLGRVIAAYKRRYNDVAEAITEEMGAPAALAKTAQAALGLAHFQAAEKILHSYAFEELRGSTLIVREPIGVCGFITPWNWPMNQMACKVAPALAVGCTMVLKPSEVAPFSGIILAEILHEAGVPPGVFNLVNGDGPGVGAALAAHLDIELISFTGSTRAGIEVAKAAAPTVKRVHQELGGKSPNIILADADLQIAVAGGVKHVMQNSGQSCNAPTRMLAPNALMDQVIDIARATAEATTVGTPDGNAEIGPVVSELQWTKIQALIAKGIEEGATLVAGGPGRPEGLETGYYVKPTIFAHVTNDMTIAREEIFGPVMAILGYDTIEEAIAIGNDTPFGLAAYVQGKDQAQLRYVASRLRAGQVNINQSGLDIMAPFGGYKQSGNGREWGDLAFGEFLETKAEIGYGAIAAE
jgi:aldehyde dehydrogenase (NAD+)